SVEVGSTPNRSRWSGYTYNSYAKSFEIAYEIANRRNLEVAGPNITDFEPFYNIIFLSLLRSRGCLPDIHSDNLFVERVMEPEAYDYRVAGTLGVRFLHFDLAGKCEMLRQISNRFGIAKTFCTHTAWSGRRIARLQDDVEEKQADYLVRYLMLAASRGAFERVYWGPLVGRREGLIDDGSSNYPALPRVVLFDRLFGDVRHYRERVAYYAMRSLVQLLAGAKVTARHRDESGRQMLEFMRADGERVHAVWTRDRRAAEPRSGYSEQVLRAARVFDRDGNEIRSNLFAFSEKPIFLIWPDGYGPVSSDLRAGHDACGIRVCSKRDFRFAPWSDRAWRGAIALAPDEDIDERAQTLLPPRLESAHVVSVLRHARNRVWVIDDPARSRSLLSIKRSTTHRYAPRNALLSWNNSSEMLRRGVITPMPLAFFEPVGRHARHFSYFVSDYVENAWTARQAFNAFRDRKSEYRGFRKQDVYAATAKFLLKMHGRGVFHRDLSAGNLLMRASEQAQVLDLWVVDTSRARFFSKPLRIEYRIADLIRLCHPLDWSNREEFAGLYFELLGTSLTTWRRLPFTYYDWKHLLKNRLRTIRRIARSPVH
ncbi:MAG TPA: lipopolysaccharide kinase InaA family protein, partial [Candidatus Binataceae bacterium]